MKKILLSTLIAVTAAFSINAQSWQPVGTAGFSTGEAYYTSLAFGPTGVPYVAYNDIYWNNEATYHGATVMKFDGTSWVNVGNPGFSAGSVTDISLAFSPTGEPYVAYQHEDKAMVMKFNGTNWVNVGSLGFSTISEISLAFSPAGTAYVAFSEVANFKWRATVMRFDGTNWVGVGSPGFSAGDTRQLSLTFSPAGEPHVAYQDGGNFDRATVMKFDGSNWINVGNPGFSPGYYIGPISLAFSPTGVPHVAYMEYEDGNSGLGIAMKFDGTEWVPIGYPGFHDGLELRSISLAFGPAGEPYVAYTGRLYRATVKKLDDTSWIDVGNAEFSGGSIMHISMAFSPTGAPYVAYKDEENSGKATVMKYSPTTGINNSITNKNTISIYPNPTSNVIHFSAAANVQLINLTGQTVASKTHVNTLDITDLPAGIYFATFINAKGEVLQRTKIVKE